jgi:hypothetical protein
MHFSVYDLWQVYIWRTKMVWDVFFLLQNIEVHFVGYLYIMDLINVWKMEYIKVLVVVFIL